MAYLTGKDLILGYDNKIVVENINFEVNKGDYLFIVGENGAGKSTLMKTVLGLAEKLGGELIYGDGLINSEIGYLPQQTQVQKDFPASVEEIVRSGCQASMGLRPFYNKTEKEMAKRNMEALGISELSKRCFRELSGGQKQRVLLARALMATKKLLVLDEPVSGLDPKATIEMYKLIKSINDEGTAVIMISHDIGAAIKYASHILHVGSGNFFGKREEYTASKLGKKYLMLSDIEEVEIC